MTIDLEQLKAMKKSILVGTARGLELMRRMPERFIARRWDLDDRVHIASSAVCFVRLGLSQQMFTVAPGTDDPACWKSLTPRASASQIVDALELNDLLDPPKVTVVVR